MTSSPPLLFDWTDDGTFRPHGPAWAKRADQQFVVGETYRLEWREERSIQSHSHFFASLTEAWRNLPHPWDDLCPSPDHLRRYALIKCGFHDERSIVCASRAEALRVAAFAKPLDEFAVIAVNGNVVTVFTAKSQSMKAMDRKQFQESKNAVLDYIAGMIGSDRATLGANADRAA